MIHYHFSPQVFLLHPMVVVVSVGSGGGGGGGGISEVVQGGGSCHTKHFILEN